MATIASLSTASLASPAAFAGRLGHRSSLSSSFNGRQLAPASSAVPRIRKDTGAVKAFLGGPGCGPRGSRYGRGFYGRSAGFPCGPQVVVVPGQVVWPGSPALDPDQFEEYQKRQKEAYESRRAAYEQRRVAWEEESAKRRAIAEKQRAFFRKQQEDLCREQQKWRQEYQQRTEQTQQEQQSAEPPSGVAVDQEQPPATEHADDVPPEEPEAPPSFPQSDTPVLHLRNEVTGAEVTVVGTAQLSEASVADVRRTIREESPTSVVVELDRQRYNRLVAASPEQSFLEDMLRLFLAPAIGPMPRAAGAALIGFYRMLAYRGMAPGREFKVAIEEAKRAGARVILGDQAIDETLRAVESAMSGRDVQAFFASPLPDDILRDLATDSPTTAGAESFGGFGVWGSLAGGASAAQWAEQLKDRKLVRKLNAFMRKKAPKLYKVLIEQRNSKLVRALRHVEGKSVAVVGFAQMDGIEQEWQRLNEEARTARQAEVSAAESESSSPSADVDGGLDVVETNPQLTANDSDVVDASDSETVQPTADSVEASSGGESTVSSEDVMEEQPPVQQQKDEEGKNTDSLGGEVASSGADAKDNSEGRKVNGTEDGEVQQ